jgi:glutamate transport system permease protein
VSSVERVLFDPPGPRGRRRIALVTVLATLVLLGLVALAVWQFARHGQLQGAKWARFGSWPIDNFLLGGLLATLGATAVSAAISMPAGALIALARMSRTRLVRWPAAAFTELFRSLPTLLLIYVFLLALPRVGLNPPTFWKLVIPICLTGSATIAEVFRAGILALDRGQTEAAHSIGMRYWQTMRLIVLPQVIRPLLPLLLVQLINLLKETTLGYTLSYTELLYSGKILAEPNPLVPVLRVSAPIQTYLAVAVLYVVLNWLITRLAHAIERRQGRVPRFRINRPRVPGTRRTAGAVVERPVDPVPPGGRTG